MTRHTLSLDGPVAMITGAARGIGREHVLPTADKTETACAVGWLASRKSDFPTGQPISPNGGQTIAGI